MNGEKVEDTVVKDALKITNTLNKHLGENCSHCKQLFKEVFKDE
jgi:hypothetical protein